MPSPSRTAFEYDNLAQDRRSLQRSLANRLIYTAGKDPATATRRDWFYATAYTVRERLIERWMETQRAYYRADARRVYYLSMEFLTGRLLTNSLLNMGFHDECRDALWSLALDYEAIRDVEQDAALGNGGLGRLAACFLDSMATLSLPGYGYGIRYEYGMFQQRIENGYQVEHPDTWLRYGNPWEFPRPEVLYPVRFGGQVVEYADERGRRRFHWVDTDDVMAMAFDTPVPGYGTTTVNNMRLWSAKATHDFDLRYFNEGDYIKAVAQKNESENLSRVLYPDDSTRMGRELRLKQQYFFVSASLQDIVRRYLAHHDDLDGLPGKVAIQLNDTHPSLAIPELMRLLVDQHGLDWDRAWDIARRTFSYTNHTLMPEALETWPVALFEQVLPRHLRIIYDINHWFLEGVRRRHPGDVDRLRRLSLIDEAGERRVRMAHLAIVGSHTVNGVSQLHTDLMRQTVFADFEAERPGAIVNVTNGITPRRWLNQANPELSALVSGLIGSGWTRNLAELARLQAFAGDPAVQQRFLEVKHTRKALLATRLGERLGVTVDASSLFDVHVKRIHEYKRQLLNLLHVITRYNRIKDGRAGDVPARTVIFAGKAAPGYAMAKLVIKLIHAVGDVVNHDPAIGGQLRVAFVPDYNVSNAERIIPASDLSEQISTAGTEASGTGNMKLALNGALTIGTLDGANIEMREAVGADHCFIFGLDAEGVRNRRAAGYDPWQEYHAHEELRRAVDMIADGYFSLDERTRFRPIVQALTTGGDHYMLLADYASYVACQDAVDACYRTPGEWARRALLNVAGMGRFSSDRAIAEYAARIWRVTPVAPASRQPVDDSRQSVPVTLPASPAA
ncbi:MAG: glycogen/starch/alpha-glucan phosphorylase [Acidobacteria bacterium]|nr:glycogen/starch/alpha-glucan phosphorylase [Acidobacteriota bacterium]